MSGNYINILNIIFSLIFFVHFLSISIQNINPSLPLIEVYKTKLSEIEFPLVKLCLSEIKNPEKRYEAHGYEDVDLFFMGLNQYNHTLFGWRGFQEDSISSGSVEHMLQNVSFNWMDVLRSIYFQFQFLFTPPVKCWT